MPRRKDEILLLSSPCLTGYNLEQLAAVLKMMVENIDGKMCSITDVRIDKEERKIYGKGQEIQTYGEYK